MEDVQSIDAPQVGDFQQQQQQLPEDPLKKLYDVVSSKKYGSLYNGSFDDFKKKYSSADSIDYLYNIVSSPKYGQLYQKSKQDFYNQYFPNTLSVPTKQQQPTSQDLNKVRDYIGKLNAQEKQPTSKKDIQQAISNSKPLVQVKPTKEISDKEAEQKAVTGLTMPSLSDRLRPQRLQSVQLNEDPLGNSLSELQKQKDFTLGNIEFDTPNDKKIELANHAKVLDSEIKLLRDNAFANGDEAGLALGKMMQKDLGYGNKLDEIPVDEIQRYDPKTVTGQVAKEKYLDYRNIKDLVENNTFEDAAIQNYKGQNKEAIDELYKAGGVNGIPDVLRGEMAYDLLTNPNYLHLAQVNSDVNRQYHEQLSNLPTQYPDFAEKVLSQMISDEREKKGLNNWAVNIVGKESTDKIVDDLIKEGKLSANYKPIYENNIRPTLGTWQSIGRGVGNLIPGVQSFVNNSKIETPGLAEHIEQGFESGMEGTANTLASVSLPFAPSIKSLYSNDLDQKYKELEKEGKQYALQNQSGGHDFSSSVGDLGGLILSTLVGGEALKGVNLIKSPELANQVAFGLNIAGNTMDRSKVLFPDDKWKQYLYTGSIVAANTLAAKYLPINKIGSVMSKAEPDIVNALSSFSENKITANQTQELIKKVLTDAVKSGLHGGEFMAFTGALDRVLPKLLKGEGVDFKKEAGQTVNDFLHGGLVTSVLGGVGALGEPNRSAKDHIYNMASDRDAALQSLDLASLRNENIAANREDIRRNINFVADVKHTLDTETNLTEPQKKEYLAKAVVQRANENKLKQFGDMEDKELQSSMKEKVDQLKKDKLDILRGQSPETAPKPKEERFKETPKSKELKRAEEIGDAIKLVQSQSKGIYAELAKDKPEEVLKDIAQQAQGISHDGTPLKGGGREKQFLDMGYSQELINKAKKLFPAKELVSVEKNISKPNIIELKKINNEQEIENQNQESQTNGSEGNTSPRKEGNTSLPSMGEEVRGGNAQPENGGESKVEEQPNISTESNDEQQQNINEPLKQNEDENKGQNQGIGNNTQPINEKAKEQKLTDRFNKIEDITDPYDRVLQYFGGGGKIHTSEIERLFGNSKKTTEGEKRARISLIGKNAQTIDQLAHDLWESDTTGKHTTEDYKDAIERVLYDHNSKASMQKDLVDRYDWEAAQEKYIEQKYGREAIDIVNNLSEDEMNHILSMDADKEKHGELENYIDNLINEKQDALQKPSASSVLQHSQEGVGETGGERGGMEQSEQGNEPPRKGNEEEGKTSDEEREVGITHAQTNEIADRYGLPQYEESPETIAEWDAKAEKEIKNGYNIEKLLNVMENGGMPDKIEQRIMLKYIASLDAKVSKDPSDKNLAELKRAIDLSNIAGGREVGKSLRARRGSTVSDDSLASFFMDEMDANKTDILTEKQKEQVKKEWEDLQNAKREFEEYTAKKEAELNAKAAEQEINKTKASKPKEKKSHEDYVKERKDAIAAAKEALKKLRTGESGLNAVPLPGINELIAIAPHVKNVVESLVREGADNLQDIVSKVHDEFKDVLEGISKENIRDIIAGKYNEKKRTQSELAAKMRDLRDEASLISKYEALINGKEPKEEKAKRERNQKITELRNKIKEIKLNEKEKADAEKKKQIELERENKKQQQLEEKFAKDFEKEKDTEAKRKAKAELDKHKSLVDELNKKTPQEIALDSYKNRVKKQISDLEKQLNEGNFEKPTKSEPVKLDKEGLELKDKLIKLRKDRDIRILKEQYASTSKWEKSKQNALEVLNVPRTVMSSMDFSAPLRQGLVASISHPRTAALAGLEMFKQAFDQKRFDRWFFDLRQSPEYKIMEKSGLYISDPHDPRLSAKEEAFMNNMAEKIPVVGKLIKGSERAYVAYLNKMRVDLFNRFAERYEMQGKTVENSPALYEKMANFVNSSTGRGKLPFNLENYSPVFNALFFSPRLIASRIELLSNWANPSFYKKTPKEVRVMYMKDMLKFIGLGMSVLGLAKLNGMQVEDDPRSSDFGKIKSGNTRWDIWGGFQPYIRVISQVASGERKSTNTGKMYELNGEGAFGQNRGDVLASFFRGKLSPIPSMAVDFLSGRTASGDKVTVKDEAINHLLPLLYSDISDAYKDQGVKSLFTVGVPSTFGVGVQTYQPRVPAGKKKSKPQKKKPEK